MKKIVLMCIGLLALASFVQAAQVNKIAAVVNGRMISVFDVNLLAKNEYAKAGVSSKNLNSAKAQAIFRETLDKLITELLIVDAAEKQKITVSSADVDAEITRIMQQSNSSKKDFEKRLARDGLTITSFQERIRMRMLHQRLMGSMVGRKVIVSPDEVRNYYEANKGKFLSKGETVMAIIVYPDNINPSGYAAQIAKDPSKFEEYVRQISIGPYKEKGGVMGPVDFAKMPSPLANLLKKLPTGKATPLINLSGKNSQFKKVSSSPGGRQLTFNEARPMVEMIVREPRMKARFEQYVQELRSKAVIDIRI